ncbi:hypothetical protein [Polluticoccus soli]|uniref:hypothetical protein n=1 Tax=Polluticoccus soli TaxID=3034150 RepID=UPI0023E1E025|nr:hypothetical protein [Flavipsychrobacter sp. JY13-12]
MLEKLTGQQVYEAVQSYPGGEVEIAALVNLLQTTQELLSSHLRVLELFGRIEITGNTIRAIT